MIVNYLLVVLLGVMSNTSTAAQKKYGRLVNGRNQSTNIYLVIHTILSSMNFAIMAKFNLSGDTTAILYGLIYGFICSAAVIVNFVAYKKMDLIMMSIFTKGNIVANWLIGVIIFKEKIKPTSVVSVLLIFICVLMPLLRLKKVGGRKMSVAAYFIGILMIIIAGCSTMLTQTYYKLPATNSQSVSVMCFYTNVFMVIILTAVFVLSARKSNGGLGIKGEFKAIKPVYYLLIPICGLCQNPAALINAHILKTMPLSVFTIFSTGVGSIILYLFSRFIFKENIDKHDLATWLIATVAGLISVF